MDLSAREQVIQELIAEGNDEQATRLIYALLDLRVEQTEERVRLLMQLGRRYMGLALSKEGDIVGEDIEAYLEHYFGREKAVQSPPDDRQDYAVLHWYAEAGNWFSAALEQALSPQAKSEAALHLGFVRTLCKVYDLALAYIELALSFELECPKLFYWQGILYAQQGAQDAALASLNVARLHGLDSKRYCRAYARIVHGLGEG